MKKTVDVVIMGSGALGSLYGGLIQLTNRASVTLVARPRHVNAIKERGLQIRGVLGEYSIDIEAVPDPKEIQHADLVFITTKSYDTRKAARELKHLVSEDTYFVCLQNGIGTEELVSRELNTKNVLRATSCMGAMTTGNGEVKVTGTGITEVGTHYEENSEVVDYVVNLLQDASFEASGSEDIEAVVWTKTIVNCGINPVGALTGLTNGEVYKDRDLRALVVNLVEEAAEVAEALDINLNTDDPVRYTLGTAKATSENINSMLQDIVKGKRTEIDFITGEIVRKAEKLGLEAPFSKSMLALVRALERKRQANGDGKESLPMLHSEQLVDLASRN
ncbi:MAG: 2-dehydropantoate 2-reductase [Candidatus Lokiarchaeota archaeon]|nr:2-dehydropantoate 2-reductase [Candidatus Lokiarchaeota archaeon]